MILKQTIVDDLYKLVNDRPVWVAYSGGVDSHVLLHLIATSKLPFKNIHVIHVDHQLQSQSEQWAVHCETVCRQYGLPFHLIHVDVERIDDLGLEAAARQARYQAFKNNVPTDAVLVTAQHQHDQAETLLLQLLRGAGPKGLAAMAEQSNSQGLNIVRPLLNVPQIDIENYAREQRLKWIEDPSNQNTELNRNYIRKAVWPVIEQRWPSAAKTLSRSSRLCAEADSLLSELAQQDLAEVCDEKMIKIDRLLALSVLRQRNCLRFFIQQQGLALPSEVVLQQIIESVCKASEDATPKVTWQGCEAIRYQQGLYIQKTTEQLAYQSSYDIKGTDTVILNELESMSWLESQQGIKRSLLEKGLKLRFRQGGEQIQLANKQHHQSVKKLFQQWQVPPWQRERIPLLFDGDELICIVGHAIAQQALPVDSEQAFMPHLKWHEK